MSKLIDADALKKRFAKRRDQIVEEHKYGWEWEYNGFNAAIIIAGCEAVENPIIPEPHWIPCSERMPELDSDGYSDKVLVCFSNFPGVEICEYRVMNGTGKWYAGDTDDSPEDIGVNVIAWQLLPEPYKEEKA